MEIKKNGLRVYELPPCDEDEDASFRAKDKQMKASISDFCSVSVYCNKSFILFTFLKQQT